MRSSAKRLWSNQSGAIAAVYALALPALIAVGGIAFDYARLVAMDSELQNAADQSALAAVTQLDQQPNACLRASERAVSLVTNNTLFANEAGGVPAIVVINEPTCDATGNIKFWRDKEKTQAADRDANARFVEVTVNARTARYALTPIVGAFNSGAIAATAMAGLGSAVCKVPPVMICNPQEAGGNLDVDINALAGKGLRLVSVGNSGGWAPGNFGYLDTNGGSNGAPGLREALGWETPPGDCQAQTGVDTKPGATVSVTDALNTRFDIYDGNVSCPSGGACPASINSVKDLVRPTITGGSGGNGGGNGNNGNNGGGGGGGGNALTCTVGNGGNGWQLLDEALRYWPTSATAPLASTSTPRAMGHPRDICHAADSGAAGYCSSPIGNGLWDRNAYFRVNYPAWANGTWPTQTGLPSTATRYQVYAWEIANRGATVGGQVVLGPRVANGSGANSNSSYGLPVCSAPAGYGAGQVPGPNIVDRRRVSVAVVNCLANSVNGNSTNVPVAKWMEIFLVEPSINRGTRTSQGDVYAEVIGETLTGGAGSTAGQVVRRDVPYLIE